MLNSILNPDAGYTLDDFTPIAGKLKSTNSGIGGDDWYIAVMIERLTGTKMNHIPFAGEAPAWQAVAGGHADANSSNASGLIPQIKSGKLKKEEAAMNKVIDEMGLAGKIRIEDD